MKKKIVIMIALALALAPNVWCREKPILTILAADGYYSETVTKIIADYAFDTFRAIIGGTFKSEDDVPEMLEVSDIIAVYSYDSDADMLYLRLLASNGRWTMERGIFSDIGLEMIIAKILEWYEMPFESNLRHIRRYEDDDRKPKLSKIGGCGRGGAR